MHAVSEHTGPYNVMLIVVMCSVWAGNYFVIKGSIAYVDPILFALVRSVGAGVLLMVIGRSELSSLKRSDVAYLALIGLFQVSIFYVALNKGLETVSSAVAATLVYTQPVLVVALSPLIGERLNAAKVAGVVAAFIGMGIIFLPDLEHSRLVSGDALELIASISWVISVLIYKKWKHGLSHYTVPGMQNLLGALFIVPFLPLEKLYLAPTAGFWIDTAYIVLLGSGLAYVIYFRALTRMQASVFSSYLFLVPTLTTLFESILTRSVPSIYQLTGTILVSAGIIVVNRGIIRLRDAGSAGSAG